MAELLRFFATTARGLESMLAEELHALAATAVEQQRAGVAFSGTLETAYRACLRLRTASRVLLHLSTFPCADETDLYAGVHAVPWLDHLTPDGTLAVDCTTSHPRLTHSHFAALKTKDAVVDQLREQSGRRPSIDKLHPDVRLNLHLERQRGILSLDLSGESLHRRGYRAEGGEAPLKENLAAAILLLAGWPDKARAGVPLLDPMCGSGTFLVEAGWMATGRLPGLGRRFGFERWQGHSPKLWQRLLQEAAAEERDRPRYPLTIVGSDVDEHALGRARQNLARAGLTGIVRLERRALADCQPLPSSPAMAPRGLLVVNPPYGERLGDKQTLGPLYQELGDVLRRRFMGWEAFVLAGDLELAQHIGLKPRRRHLLFNGAIECRLLEMAISDEPARGAAGPAWRRGPRPTPSDQIDPASRMFANRLEKNAKHLAKWAQRDGVSCYRVYDADLPEYAVAIDRYENMAQVQEYEPPATVDAARAGQRLRDVLALTSEVLQIAPAEVVLKVRRRQRGARQYERLGESGDFREVREGGLRFCVNLRDYLDTGLYLDERLVRARIRELAPGRRFLNLFAYTGTASIYAAAGGAVTTTSVDLSATYLEWAQRNFTLNGLDASRHHLERADCLAWLPEAKRQGRRFDLIFLAPPTFSNSKAMRGTLDLERDQLRLIEDAAALLSPHGILLFSHHLRGLRLDPARLAGLRLEDISRRVASPDFARSASDRGSFEMSRSGPHRAPNN